MTIYPSIDLKDGRVVRLVKGEFDTVSTVADDPLTTAEAFRLAGAEWMHMVDLDGALNGLRKNAGIVERLAGTSGLKIELGGGLRGIADIETVFAAGVERAVIGSAAVTNRELVRDAVERWGGRIAVGIDARDGKVRTQGWTENSGLDALEFALDMQTLGVETIIFTDIETDGTLAGPSFESLRRLRKALSCSLIASGGVGSISHIAELKELGVDGAIIGKAYYAGAIDLREAIALCR